MARRPFRYLPDDDAPDYSADLDKLARRTAQVLQRDGIDVAVNASVEKIDVRIGASDYRGRPSEPSSLDVHLRLHLEMDCTVVQNASSVWEAITTLDPEIIADLVAGDKNIRMGEDLAEGDMAEIAKVASHQ